MKKARQLTKEERNLLGEVLLASTTLQRAAKGLVQPPFPEYECDPLDLTPEQEAEICKQIRRSRGHDD